MEKVLCFTKNLTDVSMLAGIRRLDLSFCYKLSDVSMLGAGSVEELTLRNCRQVAFHPPNATTAESPLGIGGGGRGPTDMLTLAVRNFEAVVAMTLLDIRRCGGVTERTVAAFEACASIKTLLYTEPGAGESSDDDDDDDDGVD